MQGTSINTFKPHNMYPMIYAGNAPNTTGNFTGLSSRYCEETEYIYDHENKFEYSVRGI